MDNLKYVHYYASKIIFYLFDFVFNISQVYKASTSTRIGPGGIKETKKAVSDSKTGVKKLAIGHHIGDRAHIVERQQNVYSGDQEENQEYINLDDGQYNLKAKYYDS